VLVLSEAVLVIEKIDYDYAHEHGQFSGLKTFTETILFMIMGINHFEML